MTKRSRVFAIELRAARKARGLSQTDLAQMVTDAGTPISRMALLRIENGQRNSSLDEAHALTAVINAYPPPTKLNDPLA